MKYFLATICLLCIVNFSSFAQRVQRKGVTSKSKNGGLAKQVSPLYDIATMSGKWQEVKRKPLGGKKINFEDSLYLEITKEKSYLKFANDMSIPMRGEATVEAPATLIVSGYFFTIKQLNASSLVIQDDEYSRTLKKVKAFAMDNYGKDTVNALELEPASNVSMHTLQGHWSVYKKTAAPGFITDSTILIQDFTVTTASSEKLGEGKVKFYNGLNLVRELDATFKISGNKLFIISSEGEWQYNILEAKLGSFVFGSHEGVVNYASQ